MKGDVAILTARLRVVEKERDERCVTDVNGVRQPLHEVQLAQPGPGEVNVGSGQQGKRVAVSFVAALNTGSLKVSLSWISTSAAVHPMVAAALMR
jgi:hypothetical protein